MARQRGNKWQADVIDASGARHRPTFETEADATAWETLARRHVSLGLPGVPDRSGATDKDPVLVEFYEANKHVIFHGNITTVDKNFSVLIRYLGRDIRLSNVTTKCVDEMVSKMIRDGKAGSTINGKLNCLSKIMRHAKRVGLVDTTPDIQRRRTADVVIRWVTKEEEEKAFGFFLHCGLERMYHYSRFLLYTGARFSEPMSCRRRDLKANRDAVTFNKTKNGSQRTVPLTSHAKEAVEWFLGNTQGDYPFAEALTYQQYRDAWALMKAHMGKTDDERWTPHILRHTCASRLVQAGVDLRRVQKWMGHKSIQVTLRYANLAPGDLDMAVGALEG